MGAYFGPIIAVGLLAWWFYEDIAIIVDSLSRIADSLEQIAEKDETKK